MEVKLLILDSDTFDDRYLLLDQTVPQTFVNGIPLLTGLTPTQDYEIITKKYADDTFLQDANDVIKDTHIDWGSGANQVSADDIPDGATNIIPTSTQLTRIETGSYFKHFSALKLLMSFITPTDNGTEVDQSGMGNNANYYDASDWSSAALENIGLVHSLSFDGSNDLLVVSDSNDFSFGDGSTDSSFSIGLWFNFTQPSAIKTIIAKYDPTTASPQTEWWLRSQANNTLMFLASDNSEAVTPYRLTNSAPSSGWHFVVVVYNSSGGSGATFANGVTFYIDGVSVASTAGNDASYVAMENLTAPVTIGANKNTAGNYTYFSPFDYGRLFISKEALTAAKIWQMYQETRGFYNI